MTITELTKTYNFHDSLITGITRDVLQNQLVVSIEFSFWAQEGVKEGVPETGMIKLVFHEVEDFDCAGLEGNIDYFSILDATADNNKLSLHLLDDFHDKYYELFISSPNVGFLVIGEEEA